MRLTISREKLQEGLAAVGPTVPTKTTLPVLSNLLVEGTERSVVFSATDLDIAVRTEVVADVEEKGAVTVPAKKLIEIARELPPAPVKLSTIGEQRLLLDCGRAHFKILGTAKEEFPSFPIIKFVENWELPSAQLQTLIGHTAFAVSTEESRPILNGVLWEIKKSAMSMIATNGHRLARMEIKSEPPKTLIGDLIVPPKGLEQIRRLFSGDEKLAIGKGENHLAFRSPFTAVYTRLIEGPYPPYEQVIPRENDKIVVVDKSALTSALRRMSVVASDQTHRIRMSFNTGLLKFSVQTPDLGEAEDELAVRYIGDPLDIGFNANYLLEVLRYMPTEQVKMTLKAPERAATIEPENWLGDGVYLCLVMPLRLVD
jgi:DNA polymerase III subunit beta